MNPGVRILLGLISFYQRAISPGLGDVCRYQPSCSEYAALAIADWGAVRGCWLALKRLLRCHPFHPGGFDLPPRRSNAGAAVIQPPSR